MRPYRGDVQKMLILPFPLNKELKNIGQVYREQLTQLSGISIDYLASEQSYQSKSNVQIATSSRKMYPVYLGGTGYRPSQKWYSYLKKKITMAIVNMDLHIVFIVPKVIRRIKFGLLAMIKNMKDGI